MTDLSAMTTTEADAYRAGLRKAASIVRAYAEAAGSSDMGDAASLARLRALRTVAATIEAEAKT